MYREGHLRRGRSCKKRQMPMLNLATRFERYQTDVQAGEWSRSERFCLMGHQAIELSGKTLGLIGAGELAVRVANLARAFGMKVLIWDRTGQGGMAG